MVLDRAQGRTIEIRNSKTQEFFAPNLTSLCQPLDQGILLFIFYLFIIYFIIFQGIIAYLKSNLRKYNNNCVVANIQLSKTDRIKKLTQLHSQISKKLVKYCWVKAGLLDDEIEPMIQQQLDLPIDKEDEMFDEIADLMDGSEIGTSGTEINDQLVLEIVDTNEQVVLTPVPENEQIVHEPVVEIKVEKKKKQPKISNYFK